MVVSFWLTFFGPPCTANMLVFQREIAILAEAVPWTHVVERAYNVIISLLMFFGRWAWIIVINILIT